MITVLPYTVGGCSSSLEGVPSNYRKAMLSRKGGMAMVTYDELFQFGLLIVAIVGLVYKISHKK